MTFPFLGPRTQIRPARSEDTDQLVDLYYEFFTRFNLEQTLTGVTKELLKTTDDRHFCASNIQSYFDEGYLFLVAEKGAKIVGLITGTVHSDPRLVHHPEAEIVDWFVTESERKQGAGKKLYDAFVAEAKRQGCKSIAVEAFAQNTATIATYERMGFVQDSVKLKKLL
jgi:ribosomal protein S18 acetylase RimI-like enzyme